MEIKNYKLYFFINYNIFLDNSFLTNKNFIIINLLY